MSDSEAAELQRPPATSARAAGNMAQDEGNGSRRTNGRAAPRKGVDGAFDLWLTRGLHQLYDAVAKEPLPPELLELIEEDRKTKKEGGQ